METRVQKWGNSLAIRIPKAFADEIDLTQDTAVELTIVEGALLITPIEKDGVTLEELLAGITDANLHTALDTGPAVGNETW